MDFVSLASKRGLFEGEKGEFFLGGVSETAIYSKDIAGRIQAEEERKMLIHICASCKRIRNDKGYWEPIEIYLGDHTEACFSHDICPECAKKLYPEYFNERSE